jgi:alpha-tubulin suppressor-like RCC1 family protein
VSQVEGLHGVVQLALGGGHALALRHTGQAIVWGTNEHGVLGLGSGAPPNPRLPLPLEKPHFEKVGLKHLVPVSLSWLIELQIYSSDFHTDLVYHKGFNTHL